MQEELRIYHARPDRLERLVERFKTRSIPIMARHSIEVVSAWTTADDDGALVYIARHAGRPQSNWDGFYNDPEWLEILKQVEGEGPNAARIESHFLDPA